MKVNDKIEPRLPQPVPQSRPPTEFEAQLNAIVEQTRERLNNEEPAPSPPREITPTERVSEDLAKSLLAGAQDLVTEAQNILHDDEAFADGLRKDITERVERHARFMQKLSAYRESNTQARAAFHEKENKP